MYKLKLFNIADEKVLGLLFKILRKKFEIIFFSLFLSTHPGKHSELFF